MREILRKIIEAPESQRKKVFWVLVFITTPIILAIWVFSMSLSLQKIKEPENASVSRISQLMEELKAGIKNVREVLAEMNIQLLSPINEKSLMQDSGREQPGVHLNIEE
ncbi:MAG: hypothetical protein ACK4NX_00825 [Candidatus Paceibacteria bacterium]